MAVRIVTDSVNYLPKEDLERLGIEVVSLHINDAGETRRETDIDFDDFYVRLADTKVLPTSAQPSPETILNAFRRIVADGDQALGVFMSGEMSGTVESARMCAGMILEGQPDARIEVLDSESNCMQEGFAVLSAAEAAASGATLDECVAAARETMARSRFVFTPNSLTYLERGGRIGRSSALLGSLLQICPVLTVEEAVTTTAAKVRTHSKALRYIAEWLERDAAEHGGLKRAIVHSIALHDEAERFAVEQVAPIVGTPVPVIPVGPVIGTHVGPAVGVVYETEEPLR